MSDKQDPVVTEEQPASETSQSQTPASVKMPSPEKPVSTEEEETLPSVSPTAKDTHEQDLLGMGRTAGQRTAEVFAGLRSEMMRTPEANALSNMAGRITARLIMSMGSKKALNFVPVRHGSFEGLIKQTLGSDTKGKVFVEIAAGYSPRGIALANELPDLEVIEIDLPDVIAEKRKRLDRNKIEIPLNITWKEADLGIQPLDEVLEHQQVDVVSAEGLMPYFKLDDITRIAHSIWQSLKPGGVFIADLGFTDPKGAQETGRLVKIFGRYTSSAPGYVTEEETAYRIFRDAGYETVEIYRLEQTATLFNLPQPVSDVLFIMVSQRKAD